MVKLIVFDWDDTVVFGSKEGYFSCYKKAVNSVGVFLDPKEENKRIIDLWSKTNFEEIKGLLKEHPDLVHKANNKFEELYWGDGFVGYLKVKEGTRDLLSRLEKKYKLAIATSGNSKIIKEKIIPTLRIPVVFSEIISSEQMGDVSKMKPNPLILQKIMKKFKVLPSETIYVGDAKTDVQMAIRAKVEPVVVLSGLIDLKTAKRMGVKKILSDITQLEQVL